MGWSWAFWFVQMLHEQILDDCGIPADRRLRDSEPAPDISHGEPAALPYSDNLNIIGTDKVKVLETRILVQRRFEAMGFEMHDETCADDVATVLGGQVRGRDGHVRPRTCGRQGRWISRVG